MVCITDGTSATKHFDKELGTEILRGEWIGVKQISPGAGEEKTSGLGNGKSKPMVS